MTCILIYGETLSKSLKERIVYAERFPAQQVKTDLKVIIRVNLIILDLRFIGLRKSE